MLRTSTVNHQEMAERQKIRERNYAKRLEAKDFGKRTQDSKSWRKDGKEDNKEI